MALYSNHGKGGADGQAVTNLLLSAGGDNPLIMGGAITGWTFEAADRSPDGPSDGHGFRRAHAGAAEYLRAEFTPTGQRSGARGWIYVPKTPEADWNILRLVNSAEQAVSNVQLRSSGRFRITEQHNGISASQSDVIPGPGWYCIVAMANYTTGRLWYWILDEAGDVFHSWDSGTGGVTLPSEVGGFRIGNTATSAHGIEELRIGSRVSWGSMDTGMIPGDVDPYTAPPEPPPPTNPVSHYNTAEGLTVGDLAPFGDGEGPEGVRMSGRYGSGGSVRVMSPGIHGSRGYRILAGADESAYLQWGFAGERVASRCYMNPSEGPPHSTQVMLLRNVMEHPVGRLVLSDTSQILLQCEKDGTATTVTLPGVVDYAHAPLRLELFVDTPANVVMGAWGYKGGPREGVGVIDSRDLEGFPLAQAGFGKLHGTPWAADFTLDDLALSVRAADFIGPYAAEYEQLTTAGADIPLGEPGESFELTGTGAATWVQVPGGGMPTVPLTQVGTGAQGARPYTLHGGTLEFDYGGARQRVGVLRSELRRKTASGWAPLEGRAP